VYLSVCMCICICVDGSESREASGQLIYMPQCIPLHSSECIALRKLQSVGLYDTIVVVVDSVNKL